MTSVELADQDDRTPIERTGPDSWLITDRNAALEAEHRNAPCTRFPAKSDGIFGARREPVPWQDIRRVVTKASHDTRAKTPPGDLYTRIAVRFEAAGSQPTDLTYLVMSALANATLPIIIDDESSIRGLSADQNDKINGQINYDRLKHGFWQNALSMAIEYRAGRSVRKAVTRRLRQGGSDKCDFLKYFLELEGAIGIRGISYLVVTLSSAVSTAPGAVAACMLHKLSTDEERFEKIRAEVADWDLSKRAPIDHGRFEYSLRFIKEALRLWPFPLTTRRIAHTDIEIGGELMRKGDIYDLCAGHFHRDPQVWGDAASFDEERWLAPAEDQTKGYFPFGFGKRSCLGASIGIDQLLIFLRLATVDFRFALAAGTSPVLSSEILHAPSGFHGTVGRR